VVDGRWLYFVNNDKEVLREEMVGVEKEEVRGGK